MADSTVWDAPRGFTAQRPYDNGVTIWKRSLWLGNGFGQSVEYVAVSARGRVIGRYASELTSVSATLLGRQIVPVYSNNGATLVTRFNAWRRAVRELTPATATWS